MEIGGPATTEPDDEVFIIVMVGKVVLTQYRQVSDGQTDRRTGGRNVFISVLCCAPAR